MKNLNRLLGLGLVAMIALSSCSKEIDNNPSSTTSSGNPKFDSTSDHSLGYDTTCKIVKNWKASSHETIQTDLNLMAVGLIELSADSQFVNILNDEVSNGFYGESEVLIRDLKTACQDAGYPIEAKMEESVEEHGNRHLKNNIGRIDNIGAINIQGTTLYPSVFIPGFSNVNTESTPITAYHDSTIDPTGENHSMPGYQFEIQEEEDEEGQDSIVDLQNITVSKDNHQGYLVWMAVINETLNCEGNAIGHGGHNPNYNCESNQDLFLEFYNKVKFGNCNEDPWTHGQVEPQFAFIEYPSNADGNCDVDQYLYKQPLFKKESDRKITCSRFKGQRPIHNEFINTWDSCNKNMALVVYEYDAWPASIEREDPGDGGCYRRSDIAVKWNRDLIWRSHNDEWVYLVTNPNDIPSDELESWQHWNKDWPNWPEEDYNVNFAHFFLRGGQDD